LPENSQDEALREMMAKERTNRRELILNTAARLFTQQGYTETSVRQIADEVGCTEAALYYHFKEGKRELLQHVVECQFPDLQSIVEDCRGAQSLRELVLLYGEKMRKVGPIHIRKLRWLSAEYPHLDPEEQSFIQQKQLKFHRGMAALMAQFLASKEEADDLAWILFSTAFGYGQLFINFELQEHVDFPPEKMIAMLVKLFDSLEGQS
jgi:AcrR family transcriptional regulator